MPDVAVINASPLIFLSKSDHLSLLPHFADRILVPRAVADEIQQRGSKDTTVRAIQNLAWLKVEQPQEIPESIQSWGLGIGESSVLALALERGKAEVIIDDLAGRKCAASLDVPVRGTLGVVLAAKKRGIIPDARAVLQDMISKGLYLSRHVLDKALERVGE